MPCGGCRSCTRIEAGDAPDVETIAIGGICDQPGANHADHAADGSTRIRICQVRRLGRVAALAPFSGPRRVFILDSADDLQLEAAQALLKTLEEPPGSALLLLLASDPEALPATVRSRCQPLRLAPMAPPSLSAMSSSNWKCSLPCMPRPPETTTLAVVSSGRFVSLTSWPMNEESPKSSAPLTASMGAAPVPAGTALKAVVRTVTILMGSADLTVASALPA